VQRRIATGLVLATCVALAPASATATPTVTFKTAFSGAALGDNTTLVSELSFAGTGEYRGRNEPLTNLSVAMPLGIEGTTSDFTSCSRAVLENTGPSGCPFSSKAGPNGSVVAEVAFGTENVVESATVQSFFGPGQEIYFYVDGTSPVSIEFIMTAVYTLEASGAHTLTITVPSVETVPGAGSASIDSMTLALGASHTERGLETHTLTIPTECPAGGFPWSANAGFLDSSAVRVTYLSSCPSGRPSSPLLGQREAVGVLSGEVLVRTKGNNTFVPLSVSGTVPDGSELETTNGRATVTAATTTPGQSQRAEVSGGRIIVHQDSTAGVTRLSLSLPLSGCPGRTHRHTGRGARRTARAGAVHGERARRRHVWVAESGGSWSTSGRYVSTSVEGTKWLTQDECARSKVAVSSGTVEVRNAINGRTRIVSAGQTYIASPRRRSASSRGRHRAGRSRGA
jgi:hypothetical protein